jgi:hypothetical protein
MLDQVLRRTLTRHVVGAINLATEGNDYKVNISLNGEEMRLTGDLKGGGHIDDTFRRFK